MARFIDQVVAGQEDNRDDGQNVVQHDVHYVSDVLGCTITIPAGFGTDFASIPQWLPWAGALIVHGKSACTVHDWLYTTQPCTRLQADQGLLEALRVTGVAPWRRFFFWWGVRLFGWSHWIPAGLQLRRGR
jgi:hypothetical protein